MEEREEGRGLGGGGFRISKSDFAVFLKMFWGGEAISYNYK